MAFKAGERVQRSFIIAITLLGITAAHAQTGRTSERFNNR
jgi:hypothetical protein